MRSFFKIFFASLLALIVFGVVAFFILAGFIANLAQGSKSDVSSNTVLVLDLSTHFPEKLEEDPMNKFSGDADVPGLYDLTRLIRHAKNDKKISGIYLVANSNANGFASSNELRSALLDFRSGGKFIIAHADMMTQQAYYVATAADSIYVNPAGSLEWNGFSANLVFFKGMLDKLEIQPQIFYAGKFKSATEPFRTDKMTPENKEQTIEWLGDLYNHFLVACAQARKTDTAYLHNLANTAAIQSPQDALRYKLIDDVRYDDQVKDQIKNKIGAGKHDKFALLDIGKYAEASDYKAAGSDRIALIYAEGNIVDGEGGSGNIGGEHFRKIIRKARLDKSIKAIVLRVNSGGGSALASEVIWRELEMAKADKPVVVSFGDVAASGGYYIAAGADSIFASPNTITGSIGVFSLLPNMEGFFKNKLGMTFDGVKTAPYADALTVSRPLNEAEQKMMQNSVDRIYLQFKQRVAAGRKKDIAYIDSIAQGRVWSGEDGLRLGLVDRIGSLQDAVACAARLAKTDDYRLREYPEPGNWTDQFLDKKEPDPSVLIRQHLGEENFRIFQQLTSIRQMTGAQARMPFEIVVK